MAREYAHVETWGMPIENPYPQVVKCRDMIYTRGQCDFDKKGECNNPNDLIAQCGNIAGYGLSALRDLNAGPEDLLRLVLFYKQDKINDINKLVTHLAKMIGRSYSQTIIPVPLPAFPLKGMVAELDLIASQNQPRKQVLPERTGRYSWKNVAIRSGEMIFLSAQAALNDDGQVFYPGDPERQLDVIRDSIAGLLNSMNADLDHIVKLTTYYTGSADKELWLRIAKHRATWFSKAYPVITDIPLPYLYEDGIAVVVDVVAMNAHDGSDLRRKDIQVKGIGRWPIDLPHPPAIRCGNMLFTGGIMPLTPSGQIANGGLMGPQSRTCMETIKKLLTIDGMAFQNVVKATTYSVISPAKGETLIDKSFEENFAIRASYYKFPGPASTGVLVNALPLENAFICIEVTAIDDGV